MIILKINTIVIGAGGFGRETLDVIEAWNTSGRGATFHVLGVIDDNPSSNNIERLQRRGIRYLGKFESLFGLSDPFVYFVGIGNPLVRTRLVQRCDEVGWQAGSVVHPSASIGSNTLIGDGTVICGGVQVSTNVKLGRHVHLNPSSVVGHDTCIGDFVSLNPGAVISGDVSVGESALIGAGAVVLQGLSIGGQATVGASACVTRNVPAAYTVVGIPALPQRKACS